MAGPLKTLFGALQASTFLAANNVTLVFGNEEINAQRYTMPYVVMNPIGGPYDEPGYAANTDPYVETNLDALELVEFWIYNASPPGQPQGAIDHVDAVETVIEYVLSAIRDQRAQYTDVNNVAYGLLYSIKSGRWESYQNPVSRFGRAYVLSVQFTVTRSMQAPTEATITSVVLNESI